MMDNHSDLDVKASPESTVSALQGPYSQDAPRPGSEPRAPREVAREHQSVRPTGERAALLDYLEGQGAVLDEAHQYFSERSDKVSLSYAGEWILDNYYVVYQSLRQIREDLTQRYYRELPVLAEGRLAGYPRIYALSRELV